MRDRCRLRPETEAARSGASQCADARPAGAGGCDPPGRDTAELASMTLRRRTAVLLARHGARSLVLVPHMLPSPGWPAAGTVCRPPGTARRRRAAMSPGRMPRTSRCRGPSVGRVVTAVPWSSRRPRLGSVTPPVPGGCGAVQIANATEYRRRGILFGLACPGHPRRACCWRPVDRRTACLPALA